MDVNYEIDKFISNHSLETDDYDSSTVWYSDDNSSKPVTGFPSCAYCNFDYNSSTVRYSDDNSSKPVTGFCTYCNFDYEIKWKENLWLLFSEYLRNSLGWTIFFVVAYTLTFIIGFVGNYMVILVVVKRPQMRTVTNLFIMNLAVADLLVIIFCVLPELLWNIFIPWILGSTMCKIVRFMEWISVCASAWSLAAISLDRCKAICRPQAPPRGISRRQAICTICLIWTISLTLIIYYMAIFAWEPSNVPYCDHLVIRVIEEGMLHTVVALCFSYVLPLLVIFISNILIWWNVSKRKTPKECARASRIDRMHRETRHSVGKMVTIVTLAFLLSWLPMYLFLLHWHLTDHFEWSFIYWTIWLLLGISNSSINPVLYAFMSKQFREMYKSILPKWVPFIHRTETNVCLKRRQQIA